MSSPIRMTFTPADWYWIVGGDKARYFSSASGAYVAQPAAVWLAKGNVPTNIASEQELWDVLAQRGIVLPAGKASSNSVKDDMLRSANDVLLRIAFNHENRIRTLAGQATVTWEQFKTAIKALL